MPDDDDDLDGDESTLPLECPPGYAISRKLSPAHDDELVKRHIMLRRRLGWVKHFITRRGTGTDAPGLRSWGAYRPNQRYAQYEASTREVHCCR